MAQTIIDHSRVAPKSYVLGAGNWDVQREEVQPGFLSILDPSDPKIVPPEGLNSTGRRSVLANWLADPKNPLTPRVMVNRIWQYHFGRGIVASASDFGVMGERPSNPQLLDYLAATFVENGWSIKKMHRQIMLSNLYQESSAFQAAGSGRRPREQAAVALRPPPGGGRVDPRFHAVRQRAAESEDGRPGNQSSTAAGRRGGGRAGGVRPGFAGATGGAGRGAARAAAPATTRPMATAAVSTSS